MPDETFHRGERHVQQITGETQQADRNSPMVAAEIPAGSIPFLRQQSLLVLAVLDHEAMWCVPVVGRPGWMSATRRALSLDLTQTMAPIDERIRQAAANGHSVGAIVLDFAARRRLRINGQLNRPSENRMVLTASEAYPNCPKYITQRTLVWSPAVSMSPPQRGEVLTPKQIDSLRTSDVLFLATQHEQRGLDASHRGGDPGFVQILSDRTFRFRDYPGNSLFNTLGNLELDTRVGVLVPDFSGASALALSGTASVSYEDHGQTRWMKIDIKQWMEMPLAAQETNRQLSPFNPR